MTLGSLVSYHYYKKADLDALVAKGALDVAGGVFADSGAFSAFTQRINIDCNDYKCWVQRWRHLFTAYSNLDEIGRLDKTRHNQQWLEDAGLSPVPVFHVGEPWGELERLADQYDYIAIGGMVPYLSRKTILMPWLIQVFKIVDGKSKLHGFGATAWHVLHNLPWHTTDSTTWRAGAQYGAQMIFAHNRVFQTRAHLLPRYASDLREMGFTVAQAIEATKGNAELSYRIARTSVERYRDYLRCRHKTELQIYLG